MLDNIKLLCFTLVLNHGIESIIAQQSLRFGEKGDSGHVININCGGPSQGYSESHETPRTPGAPGKMGPIGPIGPKGRKGEKGYRGLRGKPGSNGLNGLSGPIGEIGPMGPRGWKGERGNQGFKGETGSFGPSGPRGMQGRRGYRGEKGEPGRDLNVENVKLGVIEMLSATSCDELGLRYGVNKTGYYLMREEGKPVYNYCDFNIYQGVTSCDELRSTHGVNRTGNYLMRENGTSVQNYCDFKIYEGATSCEELRSRYGIKRTGYYRMGEDGKLVYNYCDFNEYEGASSCDELGSRHSVNRTGYYLMRENGKQVYNYCDFKIYEGISSCAELPETTRAVFGYYRFRNRGSTALRFVRCPDIFTCEQLQKFNGTNVSGVYTMSAGEDSYHVHCNFKEAGGSGAGELPLEGPLDDEDVIAITEVWHSSMNEVRANSHCSSQGCYSWTPRYDIPERSILKIINNSRECRQFIKVRCQSMRLLNNGNPYGWWESRQGEKMLYWGGATSTRNGYCACGETRSCSDYRYKCNCDRNYGLTKDEGFLHDKSKLPVRRIRLGSLSYSYGYGYSNGWHTLGKLQCFG